VSPMLLPAFNEVESITYKSNTPRWARFTSAPQLALPYCRLVSHVVLEDVAHIPVIPTADSQLMRSSRRSIEPNVRESVSKAE